METTPNSLRSGLRWTCLTLFAFIFIPLNLHSATFTSIANGNWTSPATWAGGVAPGSTIAVTDTVNIGHIVTYTHANDLEVFGVVNIINGTFRTALTGTGENRSVFIRPGGEWNMCNAKMILPIFSCGYECFTGANKSGNFSNNGGSIVINNSTVHIAQNWEDVSNAGAGIRTFNGGCLIVGENFTNKGSQDLYDGICAEMGWHGSTNLKNEYRMTFQDDNIIRLVGSGSVENVASSPHGVFGGPGSPDIGILYISNGNLVNNAAWSAMVLNFCINGGSVSGSMAADFTGDVTNNDTPAACAIAQDTTCTNCPLAVCMLDVTATIVDSVSCAGNDGSVTATIAPGSETEFCGTDTTTFLWNTIPAQTTQTIDSLPPGTYTVTVTDASGCTDTASVTLVAPTNCCFLVITCPAENGGVFDCPEDVPAPDTNLVVVIDSCDNVTTTVEADTTGTGCGTDTMFIVRSYIVTDGENIDTCTQTFRVVDDEAPVITCPTNVTIECGESLALILSIGAMAEDNCDNAVAISENTDIAPGMCPQESTILRTFTATDDCGNSSTCLQTITLTDNTPPMITCPVDVTVQCASEVPAPAPNSVIADDFCGDETENNHLGDVVTNMTCVNRFTIARTYSATDECGNSATCTQTITVFDNTAPMITCPANITVTCTQGTTPGTTGMATATDNCNGTPMISFTDGPIGGMCPAAFIRTWRATDECGNSATCAQSISVDDDVPPSITCPANVTIECSESTAPANTGTATATDNCTMSPPVVPVDIIIPGNCPQENTILRTWTATDICGNTASCMQTISVTDDTPPVIGCPANTTVSCATDVPVFNPASATTSDNCDVLVAVTSGGDVISNMTCVNRFTLTRTYIATDDCGNSATCIQIITVNDITPPMVTCPADMTVTFGSDTSPETTGFATASDNCVGMPMVSPADVTTAGGCPTQYSIARTWTATDACGNTATCIQDINVNGACNVDLALVKDLDAGQGPVAGGDNVNFTITVTNEGDVTIGSITIVDYIPDGFILNDPDWTAGVLGSTGQSASIVLSSANGGLDADGLQSGEIVMVQITLQAEPDIMSGIYINTAEITAVIDSAGNDVTTADVDSDPDADDTNDPPGEDDIDPALICVLSVPVILGDQFVCSGDTTIYTLMNFDTANTYMWTISGGGIIIENNDSSIVVAWTGAPGGPFIISVTEMSDVDCFITGMLEVFIQGGDAIACIDHINLSIDSECGTVVTSGLILTGEAAGDDNYQVFIIDMTTGDTIPNATLTFMHLGQTFKVMVVNVCSGQACWGLITVEDKMPPVIDCVCPLDNEGDSCIITCLQIDTFLAGGIPNILRPTTLDNCGATTIEIVDLDLNFETCSGGFILVTWLATDFAGNTSTCVQEFFIEPLTLDSLVFPPDFIGECTESSDPSVTGWPTVEGLNLTNIPTFCNIIATYTDLVIPLCGGGRKILRTWTVFDWCVPVIVERVQLITLMDRTGPILTCPADMTVGTDVWFCSANIIVPRPAAVDSCSAITTFTLFYEEGIVIPTGNIHRIPDLSLGTHTMTWFVTDACGNSSSCSFDITVVDDVPPVMSCQQHLVISLTSDRPDGITLVPAEVFNDLSMDNCSPVTFTVRRMESCINVDWTTEGACEDDIPGGTPPINSRDRGTVRRDCVPFACCDVGAGPIMVEVTGEDAAGNVNICMVTVEIQDKIGPTMICPPDISVSCLFDLDVIEGTFSDFDGNDDGTLDEDPLSEIFGNMLETFRHSNSDRQAIIINDPANITLAQPFNWGLDGITTDNCEVSLSVEVSLFEDCSGEGLPGDPPPGATKLIIRRFEAVDNSGNPASSCEQRIWVIDFEPFFITDTTCTNENPFDGVIWPCDITLFACPEELNGTGEPVILNDQCSVVGVAFEDTRFDFADGTCYKIFREWTIIDWCQFDISTGSGLWSYTQVIKVMDAEGSEFPDCPAGPLELCLDNPGITLPANNQSLIGENNPNASSCSVHVALSQRVREICSTSITYDVKLYPFNGNDFIVLRPPTVLQLDANHEGFMSFNTQSSSIPSIATDGLPYNNAQCGDYHRIVYTVHDGCGNESSCDHLLRLEDCKDPSPVCINGLSSVVMPVEGEVTIWAMDFNASSFDDCTPAAALLYSFSGTSYEPSFTYTCDNVPEFGVPIEEEIWVADAGVDQNCNGVIEWSERNKDFCVTFIIITDNNDVCNEEGLVLVGEIMTEHTDAVSDVMVHLTGPQVTVPVYRTTADGKFNFNNVIPGHDYVIRPERNDDHKNGVSTLDLVRIQKHLLGKELFASAYQYVAADANSSGSVSAIDLVEIRKLILGIYPEFPFNQSWRFINAGIPMQAGPPWPIEEQIVIDNLSVEQINDLNFIGVKIGDVNNTVKANASQILPRNGHRVIDVKATTKGEWKVGDLIEVKFVLPEILSGFQWTFETEGLQFRKITSRDIPIDESNVGAFENGITTISWNGYSETDGKEKHEIAFYVEFLVTDAGEITKNLKITSAVTQAEAYTMSGEIMDIKLAFDDKITFTDFALYQNQPNPWDGETVIGFDLPEASTAELSVYDGTGKLVKTISGEYKEGYNVIRLVNTDLPGPGIFYYRLESGGYSASKKMIILQ